MLEEDVTLRGSTVAQHHLLLLFQTMQQGEKFRFVTFHRRFEGAMLCHTVQALGFFALLVLFLMAATSHDFWLHNLTAPIWKRIHMLVYVAYALLIGHVALGALQSETSPLLAALLGVGLAAVVTLHLAAAFREHRAGSSRARSFAFITRRTSWLV